MEPEPPPAESEVRWLTYRGHALPWPVILLWVVSLAAFAAYTWAWYLPDLDRWLATHRSF